MSYTLPFAEQKPSYPFVRLSDLSELKPLFRSLWCLLLLAMLCVPHFCNAAEPNILIDPKTPTKTLPVWLFYLGARLEYHQRNKLPLPESGEVRPSFEEEVQARQAAVGMYQVLEQKDKSMHDPYWEAFSQVEAKGFMKAYVWSYLRRPAWPGNQQPRNLAAFQNWSRANLKNHAPQTYGSLAVKRK